MIFGIFKGTTPLAVAQRIEKLAKESGLIQTVISQAKADRAAAIQALQDELGQFVQHELTLLGGKQNAASN